MAVTTNEKREANNRYWVGPCKEKSKYFLSNGAKYDKELLETSSKRISNYKKIMVKGTEYLEVVGSFYSFLESEFGLRKVNETIRGNVFYDVEYRDAKRAISISYENIEDHLEIVLFKLSDGKMPDYDDKSQTLHLNQLNKLLMKRIDITEIGSNMQYFSKYNAKNSLERKLLKGAKELRLCLKNVDQSLDTSGQM